MDTTQSGSDRPDDDASGAGGEQQDTAAFQAAVDDVDDQDAGPTMTAPGDGRPDGNSQPGNDSRTTDIDEEMAEGGGGR
jgi:hypothetical protein